MSDPDQPAQRRRRRAVGPPGAAPAVRAEGWGELEPAVETGELDELPQADDDERLRRDVPPHHGS